ncbi:MAG: DUF502 domain-containing protein [Bdellovibrionales bacterium]
MKVRVRLRTYFVTGLLVIVPVILTFWLAQSVVVWVDEILPLEQLTGRDIPGLGLVLTLVIILVAGFLGQNFFGAWVVEQLSNLVAKIPFIGSVYGSLRQVMTTLMNSQGDRFGRAVLVEFPKEGSWTIGFVTASKPPREMAKHLSEKHVCVFIPTTPNPTSGFFVFAAPENVKNLDVSVDEAFKVLISLGLIGPHGQMREVSENG